MIIHYFVLILRNTFNEIINMKLNIKPYLIGITLLKSSMVTQAQHFFSAQEYGVSVGATNYFGDINPNYGFDFIKPSIGVMFRQHFNPYISVRANLLYTSVEGSDKQSKNAYQHLRNLDFKSNIYEFSVVGEFNFFWFETGNVRRRFTPYLTAGIGAFYYDPYTNYDDKKVRLKPLGTEGQNLTAYKDRKYSNFSIAVPLGVGVKYWIKPGMNLGVELANRFTFTDYMDDVSQTYVGANNFSHNPSSPSYAYNLQDRSGMVTTKPIGNEGQQRGDKITFDQYLMFQVTLSFQLKTYKCPSHLRGVWEP